MASGRDFWRRIVGHGKRSVWVYADEMRGLGITIDEKLADDVLAQTIGIGHALVRTQVLQPRVRQKCFDETAILSRILKKSPVVSAIAAGYLIGESFGKKSISNSPS
jgi:hypothetical protein